ncbi:uncharacterized protein LOC131243424 [Magnolia sinica]|uniref:uncharacterized protein LOC131243424 n=1 Tax=Magnolia sinica TaxID=86752 RepID=UPI002658FA8E|nr:uncharacterized protein LOC131243424 [Magnolia sinica]
MFCCFKRHSLREVLDAPNVMTLIKDTKAAQEVQALKDFFDMLSNVEADEACLNDQGTLAKMNSFLEDAFNSSWVVLARILYYIGLERTSSTFTCHVQLISIKDLVGYHLQV